MVLSLIAFTALVLATPQDGADAWRQGAPRDAEFTDLGDGFIRVTAPTYMVDLPKGWKVSEETRWGARKMSPKEGEGEMGAMTAPPGRQSWDQLYRTSLYFIMREGEGEATPYTLTKTAKGYEAATFSVVNNDGFADRRYVLIRSEKHGLLALNVRIPSKEEEKKWESNFRRMVDSAVFRDNSTR
ncbi:MAG: hypothetical protein LCH41_05330 [Armatimonadetes bacterium]|nr:hypothetical protein [Armatimonadota bacterium]